MTALAIGLGEGDLVMASATIFPLKKLDHGILCRTFFYPDKDIGVAKFTAVPDSMLGMGENYVGHPFSF